MNVTISARHCEIPRSLRTTTERRIERLSRYHSRLAEAGVTFERERAAHGVEIRLAVDGDAPVVARASGPDFQAALDRGVERASRQLRRARGRQLARRHAGPSA